MSKKLINEAIKNWLDANIHDGEDRSGFTGAWVKLEPDDLQLMVEELVEDMFIIEGLR